MSDRDSERYIIRYFQDMRYEECGMGGFLARHELMLVPVFKVRSLIHSNEHMATT